MNFLKEKIDIKRVGEVHSCRLFHGRGHCFPGYEDVVIDWYHPVILMTIYQPRTDLWVNQLSEWLYSQESVVAVVLQERYRTGAPSRILAGELPEEVNAYEAGLKYRLRLNGAQNIGFFPDMAVGREHVRNIASGKRVLNLFSYSCSFSVAAIAGGAEQVVNVDMNRGALELGKINHQINGLDLRKTSFLSLEIFRSFSRLRKVSPFDLIICDPPADQGNSFKAQRDWPKLIRKIPPLLSAGGEMLLCMSSPYLSSSYMQQLITEYCPQAQLLQTIYSAEDFPEAVAERGLVLLYYRIL
jgi:23S rRNA (cytosine1962-C5)-methyltransferase